MKTKLAYICQSNSKQETDTREVIEGDDSQLRRERRMLTAQRVLDDYARSDDVEKEFECSTLQ